MIKLNKLKFKLCLECHRIVYKVYTNYDEVEEDAQYFCGTIHYDGEWLYDAVGKGNIFTKSDLLTIYKFMEMLENGI